MLIKSQVICHIYTYTKAVYSRLKSNSKKTKERIFNTQIKQSVTMYCRKERTKSCCCVLLIQIINPDQKTAHPPRTHPNQGLFKGDVVDNGS